MLPIPLSAQGSPAQTPENAQRFLAINLPTKFGYYSAALRSVDVFLVGPATSGRNVCATDFQAYTTGQGTASWGIDWATVAQVKHTSGSSVVEVYERKGMIRGIDFNSPSLAARAAFAMEFLRQHCDPSADTGF
jgi:hypothetical protein